MIIVEGPDGAGKTTLIKKLSADLHVPVHERAVTSDGVPTLSTQNGRAANLAVWSFNDIRTMPEQPMSIYDRYPLVSEYVYGPVVRGFLDSNFISPIMHLAIRQLAVKSLVIFCRPPNDEIAENLFGAPAKDEMAGVAVKYQELAAAYDALKMFWPGDCIGYDYTRNNDYGNVLVASRIHIGRFQQEKENR